MSTATRSRPVAVHSTATRFCLREQIPADVAVRRVRRGKPAWQLTYPDAPGAPAYFPAKSTAMTARRLLSGEGIVCGPPVPVRDPLLDRMTWWSLALGDLVDDGPVVELDGPDGVRYEIKRRRGVNPQTNRKRRIWAARATGRISWDHGETPRAALAAAATIFGSRRPGWLTAAAAQLRDTYPAPHVNAGARASQDEDGRDA
jgi:hypothetical protein